MSDPARILDELMAAAPDRPMPRLSLAEATATLARLTQPLSAPPVTIAPPRVVPPSAPAAAFDAWNRAGAPLPSAPPISIAPPRVTPPSLPAVPAEPPRLVIVSDAPLDAPMFRLSDLEELDQGPQAGAAASESIAPNAPPPLPSDSISEIIAQAAADVQRDARKDDEIIDLDMSSVEVVFLDE